MKNGEQGAFACPDSGTENFTTWQGQVGLTKREYFAGLAMQGLLSNPNGGMTKGGGNTFSPSGISELSLLHADAILKELDKKEEQ